MAHGGPSGSAFGNAGTGLMRHSHSGTVDAGQDGRIFAHFETFGQLLADPLSVWTIIWQATVDRSRSDRRPRTLRRPAPVSSRTADRDGQPIVLGGPPIRSACIPPDP